MSKANSHLALNDRNLALSIILALQMWSPCGQKIQPWSLIFENMGSNEIHCRNVGPWC